jgi:ankyrin repeat protein
MNKSLAFDPIKITDQNRTISLTNTAKIKYYRVRETEHGTLFLVKKSSPCVPYKQAASAGHNDLVWVDPLSENPDSVIGIDDDVLNIRVSLDVIKADWDKQLDLIRAARANASDYQPSASFSVRAWDGEQLEFVAIFRRRDILVEYMGVPVACFK